MKRKSGQHRPDKRKQSRTETEVNEPSIREGGGFTQLELAPNQSVSLTGSAVLEVTAGCLSVYGALVTPESGPLKLHAPAKFGRALQLTAVATADTEPPCQPVHCPVQAVLQPLHPDTTPQQQQQQQQQLGFTLSAAAAEGAAPTWQVPTAWSQAAGDLLGSAAAAGAVGGRSGVRLAVAVAGSKGSGKSAFARLLVNSLLSQGHGVVAFLDLDPGQPEFTPPGLLSLQLLRQPVFGPAHLQQQQPLLAYFQGDTSSQSEPRRYLQAIQALVARYLSLSYADVSTAATTGPAAAAAAADGDGGAQDADMINQPLQQLPPLVINTPGWITGLGLDLLAEVLRCAQPTHVVQLQTVNAKKNLPAAAWWLDGGLSTPGGAAGAGGLLPVVLQVPSVSGASGDAGGAAAADSVLSGPSGDTTQTGTGKGCVKGVSAATARSLMWLAWAASVSAANPAAGDCRTMSAQGGDQAQGAVAAEDFASTAASLAAAVPMVVSLQDVEVEVLHAQVAPAELPVALNGALVGLAARSSSAGSPAGQQQGLCECLSFGLIRAVDARKQELYMLTDLEEEQLQRVDLLQLGKLELPDKLLECRGFASPYQGLFCLTSTATGAGQIKSRNNLLRSSQLLR